MLSVRRSAAAVGILVFAACSPAASDRRAGPPRVVATMTTLASIVRGAAGSRPDVRSLVPLGVSPEDFQPSPETIEALRNADVLIENGAGIDAWLAVTIRNAGNPHLKVVVCTDGLPVVNGNPHVWMDPVYARAYASKIRDALIAVDGAHADEYRSAASAYDKQLVALAARTRARIATIPPARRTMIVFHNAYDYYARRFGLRIVGAIEPLAGAEPNPTHLAELVRLARTEHVPAVFAEHEYSDKLARALASSAGGLRVAFLYDDSLGAAPPVDTYIGLIDTDTQTIVSSLR